MRIHHLNCGTMCPTAAQSTSPLRSLFASDRLICHCLLIEAPHGLVLVDTGIGLKAIQHPDWLGAEYTLLSRPLLDPSETAIHQIQALGFEPGDVRDIVVTHLDIDHAGGLIDFPHATVHVHSAEHAAATRPGGLRNQRRYRALNWPHQIQWQVHQPEGDTWFGFESVRAVGDDILLIPLAGHSRGHSGVAVRSSDGWLLHAGDAYFCHTELGGHCPPGLAAFQWVMQTDAIARLRNQQRLRELARGSEVRVFCSHDPVELDRMKATQPLNL